MRATTIATCLIVWGVLMVQDPVLGKGGGVGHAGGGGFGGGGFHGGSIGNAGNVNNHPYYGGDYGWGYQMGPVGFEGDGDLGDSSGSASVTAYTGTGGGPPGELQDGKGVNVPHGPVDPGGPSWDSDWWDHDPRSGEERAAAAAPDASTGTAVASLPRGTTTVYHSGSPYYYSDGVFYEPSDSGYEVVAPPLGITVNRLPRGAEIEKVGNLQYFVYNDTYYQALYGGSGVVYQVVEDPGS